MTVISEMKELFGDWMAAVARAVDVVAGQYIRPQLVMIEEDTDGGLTIRGQRTKNGSGAT